MDTLDQVCEDPLGVLAVVAGWVPASLVLAGCGVDAFVDDGVVAVSLLGDVASYRVLPLLLLCRRGDCSGLVDVGAVRAVGFTAVVVSVVALSVNGWSGVSCVVGEISVGPQQAGVVC